MPGPLHDVTHLGLDADDTLWHSEGRFREVHARYHELLAEHVDIDADQLEALMLETEQRNLRLYGYGAKGFTISLIETAIEVTGGAVSIEAISRIIDFGKDLLAHPVELLDGVPEAIDAFRDRGLHLTVITKGDLWHQESKLAASGLADRVDGVEIVAEKDEATYRGILARRGIPPERFCMVGNSVRSDVLPVLAIGGRAVHVPYEHVWAHEVVDDPGREVLVAPTLRDVAALLDGRR